MWAQLVCPEAPFLGVSTVISSPSSLVIPLCMFVFSSLLTRTLALLGQRTPCMHAQWLRRVQCL